MMRPKRDPEVAWRLEKGMHAVAWDRYRKDEEYEELGVVTLMVGEAIHQLNLVGAEIWTRINGVNTVEKIAAEVASLFDWESKEAEEAVRDFLEGIGKRDWVRLGESSRRPRTRGDG